MLKIGVNIFFRNVVVDLKIVQGAG